MIGINSEGVGGMKVSEVIDILKTIPPNMECVIAHTWWPLTDVRQDSYLGGSSPNVCVFEGQYPAPPQEKA